MADQCDLKTNLLARLERLNILPPSPLFAPAQDFQVAFALEIFLAYLHFSFDQPLSESLNTFIQQIELKKYRMFNHLIDCLVAITDPNQQQHLPNILKTSAFISIILKQRKPFHVWKSVSMAILDALNQEILSMKAHYRVEYLSPIISLFTSARHELSDHRIAKLCYVRPKDAIESETSLLLLIRYSSGWYFIGQSWETTFQLEQCGFKTLGDMKKKLEAENLSFSHAASFYLTQRKFTRNEDFQVPPEVGSEASFQSFMDSRHEERCLFSLCAPRMPTKTANGQLFEASQIWNNVSVRGHMDPLLQDELISPLTQVDTDLLVKMTDEARKALATSNSQLFKSELMERPLDLNNQSEEEFFLSTIKGNAKEYLLFLRSLIVSWVIVPHPILVSATDNSIVKLFDRGQVECQLLQENPYDYSRVFDKRVLLPVMQDHESFRLFMMAIFGFRWQHFIKSPESDEWIFDCDGDPALFLPLSTLEGNVETRIATYTYQEKRRKFLISFPCLLRLHINGQMAQDDVQEQITIHSHCPKTGKKLSIPYTLVGMLLWLPCEGGFTMIYRNPQEDTWSSFCDFSWDHRSLETVCENSSVQGKVTVYQLLYVRN